MTEKGWNEKQTASEFEHCIRDKEGRICGWTAGMSGEEVEGFLHRNPGTYLSTATYDWQKGVTE